MSTHNRSAPSQFCPGFAAVVRPIRTVFAVLARLRQDWRAERGTTWRDQLNKAIHRRRSLATTFATPNYGTTLGYGLPGYSYSGPTYDRYVTDANRSATSTGAQHIPPAVDPGLSSCPQRADTNEPSTQTYFGSDGKRHPCP